MEIVSGSKVMGTIAVDGAVVVRGSLEGELSCTSARIEGTLIGAIHADVEVELTAGAVVEATISAPRVVVAGGARFQGTISQGGGALARGPAANPVARKPSEPVAAPALATRPEAAASWVPVALGPAELPPAIPASAYRYASPRRDP